jgi:hypothetical protein
VQAAPIDLSQLPVNPHAVYTNPPRVDLADMVQQVREELDPQHDSSDGGGKGDSGGSSHDTTSSSHDTDSHESKYTDSGDSTTSPSHGHHDHTGTGSGSSTGTGSGDNGNGGSPPPSCH